MNDVRTRIDAACARARRDPAAVRVIAVSKTVGSQQLSVAVEAGITDLGENRVQEAQAKQAELSGLLWHLVGRLQSNKAQRAVAVFDEIQTIESLALARRVARYALEAGRDPYPVYLQVNVDGDPAKSGFAPADLAAGLDDLAAVEGLRLAGLMTVGRQVERPEQARQTFAALRELSERLCARQTDLGEGLSMGMSDDFEVAVEEGATVVRIGRALFGERPAG